MTSSGQVPDARAPARRHHCWGFDDPVALESRARPFLGEGLAAGEQVWFVTAGAVEPVMRRWSAVTPFGAALRDGTARVLSVAAGYADGGPVEPAAQVDVFADALSGALAAGYTGLRVVADVTPLVRTPAQRAAFGRYEYLVDSFMAGRPVTGVCAFDRIALDTGTFRDMACLHPRGDSAGVPFRLYGCPPADGAMVLAGELDLAGRTQFEVALARAAPRPVGGEIVIDASGLRFVDHRALRVLEEYAKRLRSTVVLRGPVCVAAELVELLDLSHLRVEANA
ncbi:MEDS domain-containing protein [Virgisporangium aliadipatigenens]|uniref:MEDS domain-containing protein n=1 Tax=Virgisporangium aliadipatigenens TaxID=741659 RepID=UPI0019426E9E|nr:MEDS domain-containing protein [Virgisporangium aliadipatigenens]